MASPLPPDPYSILNIPKDATLATVRSAHRKLVLTCHPDKVYDESVKAQKADQFHQVQQAYEILSDDSRRARYDERVKLAELRAELMAQTSGRSRPMQEFSPRPTSTSSYETRGNVVYEERAPRRSYEDDYISPKYEDRRSSGRRFDDRYETPTPRRTSGRGTEERRRAREYEEEETRARAAREATKAAERSSYADRRKVRDKGRRQDYDVKHHHVRVDSASDSDSDVTERPVSDRRNSEPKRKHDTTKRRDQEERSRRSYKHDDSDYPDPLETKVQYRVLDATNYIQQSSGTRSPIDLNDRRRPSITRIQSKVSQVPPPPTPPPIVELPRRDSGRTRSSVKERRTPEIVDPPRRDYESGSRRPGLPTATSEPHNIQIPPRGTPSRAATLETRTSEVKQPSSLRRAKTSPLASMVSHQRGDSAPSKSSKLRNAETNDSGYSSPGTPELHAGHSPGYTTRYMYMEEEDEDTGISSPRIVNIEPEFRRDRDVSPRTHHRSERPSASTRAFAGARPPPSRSATYVEPTTPRPTISSRTQSGRLPTSPADRQHLFGEVKYPPGEVKYSPKVVASDIQYSRRASADSPRDHRDAYAFTEAKSGRSAHPGMGGRAPPYVQEPVH
ncbi:hypothetical protein MMC34_000758 [Xylographa carneopallida]|nr:hypothetical protein [Xylographa carneopallida]